MKRIEVKAGLIGDDYTELVSGDIIVGDQVLVGIRRKDDTSSLPGVR